MAGICPAQRRSEEELILADRFCSFCSYFDAGSLRFMEMLLACIDEWSFHVVKGHCIASSNVNMADCL